MALVLDHLEEVAVDRLAKEEPLKWCGTQRIDQLPARSQNAVAQSLEVIQRVKQRHMSAKLGFKRRRDESLDEEDMQLLAVADVEPLRLDRRVGWDQLAPVTQRLLEEASRRFDVLGGESQMSEDGSLPGSIRSPWRSTSTSRRSWVCRQCW